MNMLRRCLDYLDRNHIAYSHSIHPPAFTALEVAAADRIPAYTLAKTVVYFGDTGYGMAVVPADRTVDFAEVRRLMGLSFIRLATEVELVDLFPTCEVGAMPPLGNLFGLPVLVDVSIEAQEFIAFTAGTHRDVIRMSFSDFAKQVNPLIADFATIESLVAGI
jgi:Ala-tRNA(Pro) deacylase